MAAESLLRIEGISMNFGGLAALVEVSFNVHQGEVYGLIGPNGAGKTTLFNIVCGTCRPASGQVFFRNQAITGLTPHQIALRGVARTFQVVKPISRLSTLENVMVAAGAPILAQFWAPFASGGQKEARERAMAALERVGLAGSAHIPAGRLNLGYLRRLELARALVMQPSLLLLDEPVAGLGYDAIESFVNLVRELRKDGLTVILVEHNTGVAEALCDRLMVLDHGLKITEGLPREVLANPAVIEAYLGKDDDHASFARS